MEIIKVENGFLSNNYILINGDNAIIIDCSLELDKLKQILHGKKLCACIITHGHFDHFYSLKDITDYYNCDVYMHERTFDKLSNPKDNASEVFDMPFAINMSKEEIKFIKDKDILNLLDTEFEIYEAFGHTDDSVIIKMGDNVFTGDFVFEQGYGRTDLSTGSFQEFKKYLKKHLKLLQSSNLFYGH